MRQKDTFDFTKEPPKKRQKKRHHYPGSKIAATIYFFLLYIKPVHAADIWAKANLLMRDIYSQILGISTIAAVVTASIALLLMNFSKSGRTVDESPCLVKTHYSLLGNLKQSGIYPCLYHSLLPGRTMGSRRINGGLSYGHFRQNSGMDIHPGNEWAGPGYHFRFGCTGMRYADISTLFSGGGDHV